MTTSSISSQDWSEDSFYYQWDLEIGDSGDKSISSTIGSVRAEIRKCDFNRAVIAIHPLLESVDSSSPYFDDLAKTLGELLSKSRSHLEEIFTKLDEKFSVSLDDSHFKIDHDLGYFSYSS